MKTMHSKCTDEVIMKRKIIISVMAFAMMICLGNTAYASGTPTVQFTSDNSLSYTNQSAINNVFQGMLPGVTENLDITLQNNNSKTASYYIAAKDIEALTMNTESAKTGAYDVVVKVGSTTIYNSTVGGNYSDEFGIQNTGGLEELDALQDWVYLGTLSPGQTAGLRFALTMDGVSNGDAYQESAGSIDFNFAVAYNEAPGSTTYNNVVYSKGAAKKNIVTTIQDVFVPLASGITAVKTGDPAAIGTLTILGLIGFFGLFFTRRKKNTEVSK